MKSQEMEYARSAEFEWLRYFDVRIEEFRGEGQLAFADGRTVECAFNCVQLDDGRILAECHLVGGAITELIGRYVNEPPRGDWRLEGHTVESLDILIKEAWLKTLRDREETGKPRTVNVLLSCDQVNVSRRAPARIRPTRLTYGLTNLEFRLGDERREFERDGWQGGTWDTFRFEIASTEIIVSKVTDYRQVVEQMKARRRLAVTAEATLELTSGAVQLPPYDDMMGVVCRLLSLAKGSRVTWTYSKLTDQDGAFVSGRVLSRVEPFLVAGGVLIGGSTAKELKEFVAQSYEPYLEEKEKFNLPAAIYYYLASKSEIEWNTRFLLACIAMETLVGNFAEHHPQEDLHYMIPREVFEEKNTLRTLESLVGDALRKTHAGLSDDQVKGALVKIRALNRRSFRRLIRHMLDKLGIDCTSRQLGFIELRDQVVHTGMLGKSTREQFGHYSNLICLLDKIFLGILRYEGEYLDYSEQWRLV